MSELWKNKPDNVLNSSDADEVRRFVDDFHSATFDHERIPRIDASLKAVQERIDQAYTHICTDLPEINIEILLTIQQATDTLDSLSAAGSFGKIEIMIVRIRNFLNVLITQIQHMKDFTVRSLDALQDAHNPLSAASRLFQDHGFRTSAVDLEDHLSSYTAARNELREALERSLDLLDQCAEKIDHAIRNGIPSLVYSLTNVINILRDLVSRSHTMKDPILRIMSSLQTHDIVNQDISTLSCGLNKMLDAVNTLGTHSEIPGVLLFEETASIHSLELIVQLQNVIREHCRYLEQEIKKIEGMVRDVKEDKDAIGDFLFLDTHAKSTLDIVSGELSGMIESLASRFDSLAAVNSLQAIACSQMISACTDLEMAVRDKVFSGDVPLSVRESLAGLMMLMKSQAWILEGESIGVELKGISSRFRTTLDFIHRSFDDIKGLLIQSIEGIDVYSARCLQAIGRFRRDIEGLMSTLDGNEVILEELESLNRSITSVRALFGKQIIPCDSQMPSLELDLIIHRLKNPHSDSLVSGGNTDTPDSGFTLF